MPVMHGVVHDAYNQTWETKKVGGGVLYLVHARCPENGSGDCSAASSRVQTYHGLGDAECACRLACDRAGQ